MYLAILGWRGEVGGDESASRRGLADLGRWLDVILRVMVNRAVASSFHPAPGAKWVGVLA